MNALSYVGPPQWSLWTGMVGRALVFAAIVFYGFSALAWLVDRRPGWLSIWGARAFSLGAMNLFGAFATLAILFANNRYEYEYVWSHNDNGNTLLYRLSGIWAGQQGSFLLWACCSALFGLLSVRGTGIYRRWFTVVYSVFLGSIAAILAYETPFALSLFYGRVVAPSDGAGLSPALQNYWVAIHPPTIFLGFGALTVLGAYAFAAIATNRVEAWASMVRPWAILAMTLVGVGLCMGGFWAYETLGWGGFWMWDPVENVSFVPWVMAAAFVHGLMMQISRKKWVASNLLLGALPFLLFVYGTFLTRSGVLSDTSVHSFAQMQEGAQRLLLGFFVGSTTVFLVLWSYRAFTLPKAEPAFKPSGVWNREVTFLTGAALLAALGLAAAIGMSVPMFMALLGEAPKVVEEGKYHRILTWVYIPLMLAMAFGPMTTWKGFRSREFGTRILGIIHVSVVCMALVVLFLALSPWTSTLDPGSGVNLPFGLDLGLVPWILILISLSVIAIVANAYRGVKIFKRSKASIAAFLAHIGVAVLMLGLIVSRGFEQKESLFVQGVSDDAGRLGYTVKYLGQTSDKMDRNNRVRFELTKGNETFVLEPNLYYHYDEDGGLQPTMRPAIDRRPFYDIYLAVNSEIREDPGTTMASEPPIYSLTLFYKPLTILVWIGTAILALAGILSAWYRRAPGLASAGTKFPHVVIFDDLQRERETSNVQ